MRASPIAHPTPSSTAPWWGRLDVPPGEAARLRLGPLSMVIRNLPFEWRLASHVDRDHTLDAVERTVGPAPATDPPGWSVVRFAQTHEEGALTLNPRLADRPMVARPEVPISLVGGDRITLFVSTALRIELDTADSGRVLTELPSFRSSDTWFGPSPREGELCYAMRTFARMRLDDLAPHPVRAISRITLHNQTRHPVHIERLSIPVTHLHLYLDRLGRFWTSDIAVERVEIGQQSPFDGRLRILPGPPEGIGPAHEIAPPRVRSRRDVIARALGAMLG